MYRPDRGFGLLAALAAVWAWGLRLWQPPENELPPRGRSALRIAAVLIAIFAAALGVFFGVVVLSEPGAQPRFWIALITFGLFGLPTSIVAVVIGAALVHAQASPDVAHGVAALMLAMAFFAQWLLLSAALWRRARF